MNDKPNKAAQAEVSFKQRLSASARPSRKEPAQLDPYVQQEKTQSDQQKAVRRVVGRRPTSELPRTTIARLNAESAPIPLSDCFGSHHAVDENEAEPLHFLLLPPGSFRGRQAAADGDLRPRSAVLGTSERVSSEIALLAHTQSTHPACFASDRARNDGRRARALHILDDLDTCKASVQIERLGLYGQGFTAFQQEPQDCCVSVLRANELECQG